VIGYKTNNIGDQASRLEDYDIFGATKEVSQDIFFYFGIALMVCGVRKLYYLIVVGINSLSESEWDAVIPSKFGFGSRVVIRSISICIIFWKLLWKEKVMYYL
jgi:hypothetical protein